MSAIGLASRGYVVRDGGAGGGQFIQSLRPDLTTESLEPEILQTRTQGSTSNITGSPSLTLEPGKNLKPTISKKRRRR